MDTANREMRSISEVVYGSTDGGADLLALLDAMDAAAAKMLAVVRKVQRNGSGDSGDWR